MPKGVERSIQGRPQAACIAPGPDWTAEPSFRQAQKLESLGLLAGEIAHDFNNLITTILCNCDLAAMILPPRSQVAPYLDQIESAAQRAAALSRQMLAYAGEGEVSVLRVDLNRLVREMTELLAVSLPKAASIRFDLAPALPEILADPTQMQQVVSALMGILRGHCGAIELHSEPGRGTSMKVFLSAPAPVGQVLGGALAERR